MLYLEHIQDIETNRCKYQKIKADILIYCHIHLLISNPELLEVARNLYGHMVIWKSLRAGKQRQCTKAMTAPERGAGIRGALKKLHSFHHSPLWRPSLAIPESTSYQVAKGIFQCAFAATWVHKPQSTTVSTQKVHWYTVTVTIYQSIRKV